MSVRDFIQAIPKVELNVQLTGALHRDTLLMVANQNGIPAEVKHFDTWVELFDSPEYKRLDEIAEVTGKWVKYSEDIARVVYDIGVSLSKQNIRYVEIAVAPAYFMAVEGMGIEAFIDALNDGRDKALRGWNVDMSWIFCVPRDNPRSGDDVARWATNMSAKRGNVIGLGLIGQEDAQPVGQFKRAFTTARKKELFTVAHAGSSLGIDGIIPALDELEPHRLTETWGLHEDKAILDRLVEDAIPVVVSLTRALRLGYIDSISDYPLQTLFDSDVQIVLSSGMPSLYQTDLTTEYMLAHEECGLGLDEIVELAKRSIQHSFMDDDSKKKMLAVFDSEIESAREKFLGEPEPAEE